jgi:Mn-dependent DtxR family transcriptional regulator
MRRKRSPPPSKAAEGLKQYLDIVNSMQSERGVALRQDFYRRAGSGPQTDRVIKYLEENGLIEGSKEKGYRKTKKGEDLHQVLKNRELTGLLTRDLSGDRRRSW